MRDNPKVVKERIFKCFKKMIDGKAKKISTDENGNCTLCGGFGYVDNNGFSHVWEGHRRNKEIEEEQKKRDLEIFNKLKAESLTKDNYAHVSSKRDL